MAAGVCTLAKIASQGPRKPINAGQSAVRTRGIHTHQEEYEPGEVLVLMSADKDKNGVLSAGEDFAGAEAAVRGKIMRRMTLSRRQRVLRVKLPPGKSVKAALAENWRARDRRIIAVEPNYRVRIADVPNDPLFGQLWGLNNIGQTGGNEDADIDAPEAWDIATGVPEDSDVVVAIIDSGIDYLHADLAENIWVNRGEIAGNKIDDDRNGYIDDLYGYDFLQDEGDPSDTHGHGTHVAGTIGAVGNNELGITGVNQRCKLMGVRFIGNNGTGNTANAIEAINYAVANGAKILNCSWGGGGYTVAMEAAIINARDRGVLFVAAAGNFGVNNDSSPFYPANFKISNVISVAATHHADGLAYFSNYGAETVHVGAPGLNILSCFPKFKTLFFEDFQGATTPGFDGTQMTSGGPMNRWGTMTPDPQLPPLPPPVPGGPGENSINVEGANGSENIVARGDWENSEPYLGNSDGYIETPPLDTRGLRGLMLDFDGSYEIGPGDKLCVEVWDGERWHTVFSTETDGLKTIDITESYCNEEMKVRFRWITDVENNNYFGAEIDNIHIQCLDDYAEHYISWQGTSMAAPHVAGVAALVLANLQGPSEDEPISLNELKDRIIWSGDMVAGLADKTITGRRLNAYKALTAQRGVTIISPNGGESWKLVSSQMIRWYSIACGPVVDINLLKGENFYARLAENIANNGSFEWEISLSLPAGSDYRIEITDGRYSDVSDDEFELSCFFSGEPLYPDPCDGATNVPLDTNLRWKIGGLPPVTITFDELPYGTIVDGMVIEDVTFGFSCDDATINGGPSNINYIQKPNIEGNSVEVLTLDFDFTIPVYGISYGFAMDSWEDEPNATTMVFFDEFGGVLGSFSADAKLLGVNFIEGINSGTSKSPIAHAAITFSHPTAERFALDNLTYIRSAKDLPETAEPRESGGTNETQSREYQETSGGFDGYKMWSRPETETSIQIDEVKPGIGRGGKLDVKESATLEAASVDMGEMSKGGPDCGDYIFIDSDEPNGPSFDWIDITETGTNLNLDDDDYYFGIELPFSFPYYENDYNQVGVSANGMIYFEDRDPGISNCCIPCTRAIPESFIAVYWDDLHPSLGRDDNVYHVVVGDEPNRILVVQWENVRHYHYSGTEDRVTCQAQLFEENGDILLLYLNPSSEAGRWGTVGIQKDINCGLNYLCDQAGLYPGLAVLFSYRPPCPTKWDVYFGTDPNALELICRDLDEPVCDPTPDLTMALKRGTRYYWQVIAKNCCDRVDGNDWSFTTENTAPVADAGVDQTVECACNSTEETQVTLDGTMSSDDDGTPLTYTWTGPFHENPAHGATPTVTLDGGCPGEYTVTLVVSDGIEDSEPNDVVITVADTTAPELQLSITPNVLWPPNHKMVKITPSWTVNDKCDALPQVSLVDILMNEGGDTIGDGHTTDDIRVDDDGSIYLRSERSGVNRGRIYTLSFQAVDDYGNVTVKSATVRVPLDSRFLAKLAARWLWVGPAGSIPEDLNNDGIVNFADFARFAENWID